MNCALQSFPKDDTYGTAVYPEMIFTLLIDSKLTFVSSLPPKNTGHGDGTFSRVRTFPVDGVGIPGPAALAVGLLNKDIKQDIVVAHFSGNLVSVLLNTCTKEHFKH